ncbi:ribosomal protection-like ABC-F family protein [Lachnoclostridium sp.]|uniref:ribosomal protection-like ABC-F family protein n=1 Tax=Lachnoclostridium sp. TaxID=2028282 RepID=UPI00289B182E|nr:ABC-F family ATP-binding cassette domain-containing protein [Lachnoclostridium sp.]
MIELGINNLTKYYGATKIFENITFDIKTGERIGLIGQNGCGKTTILKIMMCLEDYQEGDIHLRKGAKIGYLNQIPIYDKEIKTIEVIRAAFEQISIIKNQMNQLEIQFENLKGTELEKAIHQYGSLSEQYELDGGYELETRINKITEGLQITDNLKELSFNNLSGGEKTRVILAKILLEEPDILLLDEPTNHLDLETIGWLEGFLKEYKGSVLIISHDRYFLDSVVNKVVELEYSRANIYYGNYSYFVIEKERRFLIDYKNYQNQQKKIEQMENQIKRYRIWGEMRDSDKMFKRAKELEKRLEKMEVLGRPVLDSKKVRFDQDIVNRTGKLVLEVEDISKSFEEKTLIKNINLNIFYQDSACIIGKNGSGKSTFLKMILGELDADAGTIKLGSQVKIGYLPQHVRFEDEEQTILEYFSRLHNITNEMARGQLARVLFFKEDVNKKIKILSGGEKSRLKLCSLTFEKVNFMILDEPTNHLDIDSREVLEETLAEYEGTLLFVSHDRYFINKVADKIIEIEDYEINTYDGDYNYYLEAVKKKKDNSISVINNLKVESNKVVQIKKSDDSIRSKNADAQRTKHLALIEETIEKMEIKLKALENEMNMYNSDIKYLEDIFLEKQNIEKELEAVYEEWEELISNS